MNYSREPVGNRATFTDTTWAKGTPDYFYFFSKLAQLRQFSEKIDNLKFFRAVFDRKLFDGET